MDHILRLHVEHHSSLSLKRCDCYPGVARFRKGVDASRPVLALATVASLALILPASFSMGGRPLPSASTLPPAWLLAAAGSLVTTRTALFLLSNAILALLAADCRWFFAAGASASGVADAYELPGDVLGKQQAQRHLEEARRCAAQPWVTCSYCLLQEKNSGTASEEAFTEPLMVSDTDSTTALEALEEQEDAPATSTPELETVVEEPACETARGLDELEINELNEKFDEFIRSRRNKWIKEEAYLQWHQA
ncbi:hypothetical protein C2845_PM02G08110 [Panicum miliaceum]|uniref:DUF4408 domain-containing protein n=1 Tax=Panicum miliaceum TaxID=4540 RepID=A0A3L6SEH2_PANMI|nr:hypothetical protein C2845_PM02G08110 [Panicum miliaceum]